jgi:uncharacterized membrane protein YkvI
LPSVARGPSRGCSKHSLTSLWEGNQVKNPLDSIWGTVITGLILTVILFFVAQAIVGRTPAGT